MSWQAVAAAKNMRVGSVARKAVLLVIAEYAHNDGAGCTASIARIAGDAECHRHTAERALDSLEEMGAIERIRDGSRWSISVNLDFQSDPPDVPQRDTDVPEEDSPPEAPMSHKGTPMYQTGTSDVPQKDIPYRNRLGTGKNRSARGTKRKTPIPADFTVTDDMRAWATKNHIVADLDFETEQFIDHHAAKGSTFIDHLSAWRNWMRNTRKYGSKRPRGDGMMPSMDPSEDRSWMNRSHPDGLPNAFAETA